MSDVVLTRRQAAAVMRLLGSYQVILEVIIDGMVLHDATHGPDDQNDPRKLAEDRRRWREAEDIKIELERQISRRENEAA